MRHAARARFVIVTALAGLLCSCAGMDTTVSAPGVSLRNVEVENLDHEGQTFLLSFDVTNPNAFPLPVESVSYQIELDGQHFAGGHAESSFMIGAQSDGGFSISVELDLLRTAPKLLYTVHDGVTRDIPYRLKGKIGVDIPLVKPLAFETDGEIRLFSDQYRARH